MLVSVAFISLVVKGGIENLTRKGDRKKLKCTK